MRLPLDIANVVPVPALGRVYDLCVLCGCTGMVAVSYWDEQGVYDAMAPCPDCCPNGRRGV